MPPKSSDLARWEDRALASCFVFGALNGGYALEQPLLMGLALAALILYPFLNAVRARSSKVSDGVVLGLAVAGSIPLGLSAGEPAPALALFLVVAQGLKVFCARSERDKATSAVVGVVLAAVAAAEAVEPVVAPMLLGAIGSTACFAAIRNLRSHGGKEQDPAPRWTGAVVSPRTLLSSVAFASLVALGTIVFFFTCPRVGAKLLSNTRGGSKDRLSGFSDTVALDAIGRIKQNDRIAFRVAVEDPDVVGAEPYWRGRMLDEYDGSGWRSSDVLGFTRRPFVHESQMEFRDRLVKGTANGVLSRLTFYLEPLGTRALISIGNPSRVTFKSSRPQRLVRDDLGSILTRQPVVTPLAYEIETYLKREHSRTLLSRARRRMVERACLQIPSEIDQTRLKGYVQRALRAARLKAGASPLQVGDALADHLRRNYAYTLDVENSAEREPVQGFLYTQRRGHCELFASAHVLMLRTQGIPARLVTGFRGGEWSAWSGTYTLRQRDAHAWVEAFTERGWTRFDPTPAQSGSSAAATFTGTVKSIVDWLELRWFALVIAFDAYDQRNFLLSLRERLAEAWGIELSSTRGVIGPAAAGVVGALALLGLGGLLLRRRRRREVERQERPGTAADGELAALLAALDIRGYRLRPAETPLELAARAEAALALAGRLDGWVLAYYRRRFGGVNARASEATGLTELLASLEPGRDSASAV